MAASDYAAVLSWLYGLEAAKGMDFKLERVALALKNLGDPHQQFAAVHIAGTNGKGSVAAMLHAMFSAGGYRVGLYTSPHLVSFTERIRVGAREIAEQEVVDLAREIRTAATVRGIELTFFEFVTVMAFLYFARRTVDLAIVEVGLGGRLDATNVLDPDVAVLTTIGLDHEEFLGDTLTSVAREKAGIIKPGRPVVIGRVPKEVRAVLQRTADDQGAAVSWAGDDVPVTDSQPFRRSVGRWQLEELAVSLRGRYQRENAATAIAAAMHLQHKFPLTAAAVRRGLSEVRWPGRLDVVQTDPLVVLDGAHNVDGIATLVNELPELVDGRNVHLLFAVMRDKRWHQMVETIAPIPSSVTLTTVLPPRGEAPDVLAAAFAPYCPVSIAPEPLPALQTLLQTVPPAEVILVTGSLFLIGAVYRLFLNQRGQQSLFGGDSATLHPL